MRKFVVLGIGVISFSAVLTVGCSSEQPAPHQPGPGSYVQSASSVSDDGDTCSATTGDEDSSTTGDSWGDPSSTTGDGYGVGPANLGGSPDDESCSSTTGDEDPSSVAGDDPSGMSGDGYGLHSASLRPQGICGPKKSTLQICSDLCNGMSGMQQLACHNSCAGVNAILMKGGCNALFGACTNFAAWGCGPATKKKLAENCLLFYNTVC